MSAKRIIIMHDPVGDASSSDMLDTLVQVDYVENIMREAGFITQLMEFQDDQLYVTDPDVLVEPPSLIFNLVETLSGSRYLHHAPECFEAWGLRYTGSGPAAILLTSDKPLAKHLMRSAGVRTPEWIDVRYQTRCTSLMGRSVIVKPAHEDASIGLSYESVIPRLDLAKVREVLTSQGDLFLEEYIDGREFNVSILEIDGEPMVLSPAEIVFVDFPENLPKIVGYSAKWDEDSFEYQHTVRTFPFSGSQEEGRRKIDLSSKSGLYDQLRTIARRCWELFGLRGYARVDFRVDEQGGVWVLEVNANPCISPDSGFIAAAMHDGITPSEVVLAILQAAEPGLVNRTDEHKERDGKREGYRMKKINEIRFREVLTEKDLESVRAILTSSGFFTCDEVEIGVSLVQERLQSGLASEYFFLFAESGVDGQVLGYTCYGPIPGTESGFDLYWIAVRDDVRGGGLGRELIKKSEEIITKMGGERVYAETSSTDRYLPTRSFYERSGYELGSVLEHFYRIYDHKFTYVKCLTNDIERH